MERIRQQWLRSRKWAFLGDQEMTGLLRAAVLMFCMVVGCAAQTATTAAPLPGEWQRLDAKEFRTWTKIHKGLRPELTAKIDLDDVPDTVVLAIDRRKGRTGVLVNLSSLRSEGWQVLIEDDDEEPWFGIDVVAPGRYKMICEVGTVTCADDVPSSIALSTSAIAYFRPSSAVSVFFWDPGEHKLRRAWVSD
jgi:hypothetical protein